MDDTSEFLNDLLNRFNPPNVFIYRKEPLMACGLLFERNFKVLTFLRAFFKYSPMIRLCLENAGITTTVDLFVKLESSE